MASMSIGQLARRCGLAPSAIRYYEQAGLLPKAIRSGRQRRYGADSIGRIRLLLVAREAGFSIAETRTFVTGFSTDMPPADRWRALARRKLTEIAEQMIRLRRMRALLQSSFHCNCMSIDDCARLIGVRQESAPMQTAAPIRLRTRRR